MRALDSCSTKSSQAGSSGVASRTRKAAARERLVEPAALVEAHHHTLEERRFHVTPSPRIGSTSQTNRFPIESQKCGPFCRPPLLSKLCSFWTYGLVMN